jgi:hypothetical protein
VGLRAHEHRKGRFFGAMEEVLSKLIPEGFLTLPQAANPLAVALYGGIADRDAVRLLRERGFDLGDGAALDEAVCALWAAVESGKLQCFAVGPKGKGPLKLSADVVKGIPVLRSPRGGTLSFLRPSNPNFKAFIEWFGRDLTNVSIVFRETEITRLARKQLQARRRKRVAVGKGRTGRPSRQAQVKKVIEEVVGRKKWSSTQSIKALTGEVNRLGEWMDPVSDETVQRALESLYMETKDRRFERLTRVGHPRAAS